MKTKKKFGMRRHIGITAAATLIALGATACEEAYWGKTDGESNKDIYEDFVKHFGSEDGSFDFEKVVVCGTREKDENGNETRRVMSANCLWNQNAEGNGENSKACSDDSIQHLKILWVPDKKDDNDYTRYMAICTRWSYGSTKTDVEWDGSKLKDIGEAQAEKSLTYGSCYDSPLKCNEGDADCTKLLCEKVAYYKYTKEGDDYKFVSCNDGNNNQRCDLPDEEMSEAFKSAFNYHACPVGYTFASSYLVSSGHGMNNVCVKSVCGDKPVDLNSDNENCGLCGKKCGNGVTCSNGSCVVADKSKVLCKGEFINPENDPRYCGAKGDCSDTNPTSMDYKGMVCEGATPLCSNGRCANACVGGQIVCDGRCVDPQTDMNFCGATGNCKDENVGEKCTDGRFCSGARCATSCQVGLYLCDNKCVDGTTNPYYCGVKSDCTEADNGTKCEDTQVCVSGKCEYNSCKEPETLCSTIAGNRCINIQSDDADNCGSCGYKCAEHPVANATANGCAKGVCQYTCINNTENVGGDNTAANIRCVDTSTDVNNCGGKGIKCETGKVCVDGNCVINSCASIEGTTLCSTVSGNQCLNVNSNDVNNCGKCGYQCSENPVSNATANGCVRGVCQYGCINNTENVGSDNTAANIRCVDTSTDVNNCGGKGTRCESGKVCVNSKCVQNSCVAPLVLCSTTAGNDCISINTNDKNNCGACGYKCADHPVANAEATGCLAGVCQYKCIGNTKNVGENNTAASIRCVDTSTDVNNCGGKGTRCESGKVCVNSKCVQNSCVAPLVLCSTTTGNECIDINKSDKSNCGACGYKCADHPVANAEATGCVAGVCQYKCTGNTKNVGENNTAASIRCVDTSTDVNNCGGKGTRCESGKVCVNSKCVQNSCVAPLVLCSTTTGNECIDINKSDKSNCGACGYKCADHLVANAEATSCVAGVCQYKCTGNTTNVGENNTAASIRCVDTSTDVNNCGGKGMRCESGKVCVNSKCVQNSCVAPLVLCSTMAGNQCIDIKSNDSNNCGACGYKCAEHPVANAKAKACEQGVCQYECINNTENVGSDNTAANIRCVDTSTDVNNCGGKDEKCDPGQVCVNSKCVQNSCTKSDEILCATENGNTCINVKSADPDNCGACGYKCVDHPIANATSSICSSGKCQYQCSSLYNNTGTGVTADTIFCENCTDAYKVYEVNNGNRFGQQIGRCVQCTNANTQNCDVHIRDKKATQFGCDEYNCIITKCEPGYHVSSNKKACEPDTIQDCGAQHKNCTGETGLASGDENSVECEAGICKAKACIQHKYYLDENAGKCVASDNQNCGGKGWSCEAHNETGTSGSVFNNAYICNVNNGKCELKCKDGKIFKDGSCVNCSNNGECGDSKKCSSSGFSRSKKCYCPDDKDGGICSPGGGCESNSCTYPSIDPMANS